MEPNQHLTSTLPGPARSKHGRESHEKQRARFAQTPHADPRYNQNPIRQQHTRVLATSSTTAKRCLRGSPLTIKRPGIHAMNPPWAWDAPNFPNPAIGGTQEKQDREDGSQAWQRQWRCKCERTGLSSLRLACLPSFRPSHFVRVRRSTTSVSRLRLSLDDIGFPPTSILILEYFLFWGFRVFINFLIGECKISLGLGN